MKRLRYVVPTLLVGVALTTCGGKGGNDNSTAHIRGVNLVTDSAQLEFVIDTTDVSSASYGSMTPLTAAHPGAHTLGVAGVNPSNLVTQPAITFTNFGTPVAQNLAAGTDYTVVAYGTVADPKLLVTTTSDLTNAVPNNTIVYQVIDGAANSAPVDVYITAPEAGIAAPSKIGTLHFGESSADNGLTISVPPGLLNPSSTLSVTLTIALRDHATGAFVIPPSTFTVAEQNRVLFVIADNIGPGATPVVIDVLIGATGAGAVGQQIADPADDAELAFANVTATAPAYNVIGGLNLQSTLATDIGFNEKSAYGNVNAGVAGTIAAPTSNPSMLSFLVSFTSSPDQSYTEYAVGPLDTILGVVLQDDRRTVPTQGEFRILNASTALQFGPAVDIYLTPAGAGLDILASDTNRPAPNFPGIVFKAATAYTQVVNGTYDAYFADTATSNIFLGPVPLVIKNGTITTYVLTNLVTGAYVLLPFSDAK